MNRSDKAETDILKQYINPGRIEKAPDDFTLRTMKKIRLEAPSFTSANKIRNISLVPVLAVLATIVLIAIALTLPESNFSLFPKLKAIYAIKLPVLDINFDSIPTLNFPGWIPYLIAGIVFLSLFDRVLFGLFHREKKR